MTQQFNSTGGNDTTFVYKEPCSNGTIGAPPCYRPKCSTCALRYTCANFVENHHGLQV